MQSIRLAHEEADEEVLTKVSRALHTADTVHFLGFSYEQSNLDRLGLSVNFRETPCLGTALGMSTGERSRVKRAFQPRGGIDLRKEDAKTFLRETTLLHQPECERNLVGN